MNEGGDWLAPFRSGGAPAADARWKWGEVTCVPATTKQRPRKGERTIVTVACPTGGCGDLVGRVDVPRADGACPTFVAWHEGGQQGSHPGRPDFLRAFWVGRFPLARVGGKRAPDRVWFLATCWKHEPEGEVEVTTATLWGAIDGGGRRPTRIVGTIHHKDNAR